MYPVFGIMYQAGSSHSSSCLLLGSGSLPHIMVFCMCQLSVLCSVAGRNCFVGKASLLTVQSSDITPCISFMHCLNQISTHCCLKNKNVTIFSTCFGSSAIVTAISVFYVRPKPTRLYPMWPREAKMLDTPYLDLFIYYVQTKL